MTGATRGIRVVVTDLETGDKESAEIMDDFIVITDGRRYVSGFQTWPKTGTTVVTIKTREDS